VGGGGRRLLRGRRRLLAGWRVVVLHGCGSGALVGGQPERLVAELLHLRPLPPDVVRGRWAAAAAASTWVRVRVRGRVGYR